jgi:hypothetical protein
MMKTPRSVVGPMTTGDPMSNILKQFLVISSLYLFAPTAGALDLGTGSGTGALKMPQQINNSLKGDTQTLVSQLQNQLGVSPTQAAGGTGALMSLAKNQLEGNQFSQITDKVSGLSSLLGGNSSSVLGSLIPKVSSMADAKKTFDALGLSANSISQFAPMILDFLKQQGIGTDTLASLGSLWQTGS